MIVITFLHVLFAAIGGEAAVLVAAGIDLGFATLAALGFKNSFWFIVTALNGHDTPSRTAKCRCGGRAFALPTT